MTTPIEVTRKVTLLIIPWFFAFGKPSGAITT